MASYQEVRQIVGQQGHNRIDDIEKYFRNKLKLMINIEDEVNVLMYNNILEIDLQGIFGNEYIPIYYWTYCEYLNERGEYIYLDKLHELNLL